MKYIYQIYQDGSFSKAAEHLFMTQPALSIAVKRVESSLGAELFDRSRHPLALTQAGEYYLQAIRYIQNMENELKIAVNDLRELRTGLLRVGGTHYLNSYLLAGVLADFSREYPGIQLQVMEDSSPKLVQALEKWELDLTFSCDPELVERFEHKPAFHDHVLLAVPQAAPVLPEAKQKALSAAEILAGKHLLKDCPQVPLSLFQNVEYILLGQGNNLRDRSIQMFEEAGFKPAVKMTMAQMVTAYRFADNGIGATFISDRLVRSPSSRLDFYKLDSSLTDRLFYFLLPERNYTAFAVRAFMEYAARHIQAAEISRGRD